MMVLLKVTLQKVESSSMKCMYCFKDWYDTNPINLELCPYNNTTGIKYHIFQYPQNLLGAVQQQLWTDHLNKCYQQ